jgi:ferredoxin
MEAVARSAGLAAVAEEIRLPAADFKQSSVTEFENVKFSFCRGAIEADSIINLPKMKTHALERITGAIKNMYGCVYGVQKAIGHSQFPDADSFAGMLSKIERALKPKLHILDGVVAMEGNGPASGDPVERKVILASGDPYALDEVFCWLIAIDPALVPTNAFARTQNIVIRTSDGEISKGEAIRQYGKPDFRVDRSPGAHNSAGNINPLIKAMQRRPVIRKDRCQSCKVCVESCPLSGKALKMQGKYPVFNYKNCVRCFCCQEMCPHQAIFPQQPLPGRILSGNWRK